MVLDILCVTYFLTSITMPDRQTGDMRQIRLMMTFNFPLASGHFRNLWILCLNDLLDEDLCKNFLYIAYFLFFFWFSNMIFPMRWCLCSRLTAGIMTLYNFVLLLFIIIIVILSVSQLQTWQVMTSQIRSHIKYLIQTYYIYSCAHFVVEIWWKFSHNGGVLIRLNDDSL